MNMQSTDEVLMIVEKSSHCFTYYDLDTGAVLKRIALPPFPHEFAVTPDEKYIYIGHYGVINSSDTGVGGNSVFIVDLASGEIMNEIFLRHPEVGDCRRPHGIERDQQGGLYALSESADRLFYKKDPSRGSDFDFSVPTGGRKGHLFALTANGQQAFVSNLLSGDVTAICPHDEKQTPRALETGVKPEGRCLSPDEKTLYITNRGDDTVSVITLPEMQLQMSFKTSEDPTRIFFDKHHQRLLTINYLGKSIGVFRVEDGQLITEERFTSNPTSLSFSHDGSVILIPFMDRKVRIFEAETFRLLKTIDTLEEPDVTYIVKKEQLLFA